MDKQETNDKGREKNKNDKKVTKKQNDDTVEKHKNISDKRSAGSAHSNSVTPEQSNMSQLCDVMKEGFLGMQNTLHHLSTDISSNILEAMGQVPYEEDVQYHSEDNQEEELQVEPAKNEFLLQIAKKFEITEITGMEVNKDLALLVKNAFRGSNEEMVKKLSAAVVRPSNCDWLQTPKLNEEMWSVISPTVRIHESRLQAIQTSLVKSIVPMITTINTLHSKLEGHLQDELDLKTLIKDLTDGIALAGNSNQKLIDFRRDNVTKVLPDNLKKLSNCPLDLSGNLLFGNNLQQLCKDATEQTKLLGQMSVRRGQGFIRSRSYPRGRVSFRGGRFINRSYRGQRYSPIVRGRSSSVRGNWKRPVATNRRQ